LGLLVSREAVGVTGDEPLGRVASHMHEQNVSALLVDGGLGIVSERDMARALEAGLGPESPVTDVMTTQPITVAMDTPIIDAAALMLNEEVRHLVVRLKGDRLGIVSLRAVLAVLLQAANPEIWLGELRLLVNVSSSDLHD
jgi:CBS domain-containing protein